MKTYFPGLNTLRLLAAFSVLIGHVPTFSPYPFERHPLAWFLGDVLLLGGPDAVSLFFVLSGFLITYLLLTEQRRDRSIDITAFYIRRTLRIVPLYVAITGFTLLVLYVTGAGGYFPPDSAALLAVPLFSIHVLTAFGNAGLLSHFWTIGVEEWFYLALPQLLTRFSVPRLALVVIGVRVLIHLLLAPSALVFNDQATSLLKLIYYTRFECMALGALGAWLYVHRHPLLHVVYRWQRVFFMLFLVIVVMPEVIGGLLWTLFSSVVFIAVILNVATNPRPAVTLENRILSWWGVRTYGIYMYHPVVTYLIMIVLERFYDGSFVGQAIIYGALVAVTLATAAVSYRYLEAPFLKFKRQHAVQPIRVSTT